MFPYRDKNFLWQFSEIKKKRERKKENRHVCKFFEQQAFLELLISCYFADHSGQIALGYK